MGIEPRDLGALEKAVNDAASLARGLWITFVSFATLIAITTGTVTHKHLLLELPLKLPLLNVDLPLIGYFVAVPLFFVVFHFYVLLQLDGLAAKIDDYNALLHDEIPLAADRHLLRQRLDSFIFAQVLVGARGRREGRIGWLNRAVASITLVAPHLGADRSGPVMVLLAAPRGDRERDTPSHRRSAQAAAPRAWRTCGDASGSGASSHTAPRRQMDSGRCARARRAHRRRGPLHDPHRGVSGRVAL
jgi:hypothetical protein